VAAPVVLTLSQAGYSVVVLDKGLWYSEKDFFKDEFACCLRDSYTPNLRDESHVVERDDDKGEWHATPTYHSIMNFWNGNCIGGSSNFMSVYFHRFKLMDFHLLSEFGLVEGAHRLPRAQPSGRLVPAALAMIQIFLC